MSIFIISTYEAGVSNAFVKFVSESFTIRGLLQNILYMPWNWSGTYKSKWINYNSCLYYCFNMSMKNTDLFLSRPRNILSCFGVWLPQEKYSNTQNIWLFLVMFTQYGFVFSEFIYIAEVWGDIDAVSESSYLLFTQASVCYKTTLFIMNKSKLMSLLALMDSRIFKSANKTHDRLFNKQSQRIKGLCLFFLTSAITTCTLWAMIPLFDDAGSRSFPFKIWMPIDPQKSPHYELGYVYQMISIYISAFLFIGVDSVALTMIMFSCAQLEIIMNKIEKIEQVPFSMKEAEKKNLVLTNNKLLEECIAHHQSVIRFVKDLEDAYHANIFFQLSGTVGIICIICLRIILVEPSSVQFLSMLNYLVTMLAQLFLYCWCGNELTIRSQNLRDCLYLSPWHDQDTRFKKSLFITMERMKRPIIFRAGHYIPLSRPTFVSVLRSSYSYFAVINQASSK